MEHIFPTTPSIIRLLDCDVYAAETAFLLDDDAFSRALTLVSHERRERAVRIRDRRERAAQSLTAELLLRYALRRIGFTDEPAFSATERGKPYLVNAPEIAITISHTRGLAVCAAFVYDGGIGADVEHTARRTDMRAAERYFTESERAAIANAPEPERRFVFFDVWTRKESVFKAYGGEADVSNFDVSTAGVHGIDAYTGGVRKFDVYAGNAHIASAAFGDYRVALCVVPANTAR